ncbi:hypothetical protein [Pueribacillus sp. YX66]
MISVKRAVKFVLVGNATVLLTLLFLPIFLITDQINVFNHAIDYLWQET